MKLSCYCFGLLAAGLIVYAALLPRSGSPPSPTSLPATRTAQELSSRSQQTTEGALFSNSSALPAASVTGAAARHRKGKEERRSQQEERRLELQREIERKSALTGISTNILRDNWEDAHDPSASQRRQAVSRAKQKEEDLAKSVNVELWARAEEMERLSASLRNGMSLQEVKQLFGTPFKVSGKVVKPGLTTYITYVPVSVDQAAQFQGAIALTYTPHPTRVRSKNPYDTWRILTLEFDADKKFTGFRFITVPD